MQEIGQYDSETSPVSAVSLLAHCRSSLRRQAKLFSIFQHSKNWI